MNIELFIVNTYFDSNEYDNPIKTYIEDGIGYSGVNGISHLANFYFQNNEIETQNSYLSMFHRKQKYSFINLDTIKNSIGSSDESIFKFGFIKSNKKRSIERSVFTFLDLIGTLGGIFEIFSIIGGILVAIFSEKMFYYSVLSNLYQVDTIDCQKDHVQDNFDNSNRCCTSINLNQRRLQESKSIDQIENSVCSIPDNAEINQKGITKNRLIEKARLNMHNRRVYNYNTSDIVYNIFCCCCLKN